MKISRILSLILAIVASPAFSQNAPGMSVADTRGTDAAPNQYPGHSYMAEFKQRSVIGLPGASYYSGLLTFTPWQDNSGDQYYQMGFSDAGMFLRSGWPQNSSWGTWNRLLTADINGNVRIDGGQNPTFLFKNDIGSFEISRVNCSGCFALGARPGDTVMRNFGSSHNIILALNNDNNDGNSYIAFADNLHGSWIKFYNNQNAKFDGKVFAKEIEVKANVWSDFVFRKDYRLPPLKEVEEHIVEKGHLSGIPTEEEVLKNGINVAQMDAKLLQKIEELTLYIIDQDKRLRSQELQIGELDKENRHLKIKLEEIETIKQQFSTLLQQNHTTTIKTP